MSASWTRAAGEGWFVRRFRLELPVGCIGLPCNQKVPGVIVGDGESQTHADMPVVVFAGENGRCNSLLPADGPANHVATDSGVNLGIFLVAVRPLNASDRGPALSSKLCLMTTVDSLHHQQAGYVPQC